MNELALVGLGGLVSVVSSLVTAVVSHSLTKSARAEDAQRLRDRERDEQFRALRQGRVAIVQEYLESLRSQLSHNLLKASVAGILQEQIEAGGLQEEHATQVRASLFSELEQHAGSEHILHRLHTFQRALTSAPTEELQQLVIELHQGLDDPEMNLDLFQKVQDKIDAYVVDGPSIGKS